MAGAQPPRVRRPGAPGDRTVRHILAVSDAFVALTETARTHDFRVVTFQAEPSCWWPNGLGGYVKPDAYTVLGLGRVRDHWWLELDLATESLPAVKRQLLSYLDFAGRGQQGPGRIMPRIAIATTSPSRQHAIQALVRRLPDPAPELFRIMQIDELANSLYRVLRE